jgi:hypothetical protein
VTGAAQAFGSPSTSSGAAVDHIFFVRRFALGKRKTAHEKLGITLLPQAKGHQE